MPRKPLGRCSGARSPTPSTVIAASRSTERNFETRRARAALQVHRGPTSRGKHGYRAIHARPKSPGRSKLSVGDADPRHRGRGVGHVGRLGGDATLVCARRRRHHVVARPRYHRQWHAQGARLHRRALLVVGMHNIGSQGSSSGAGRELSAPSVSEIVVTEALDKASPLLWNKCVSGTHFVTVTLYRDPASSSSGAPWGDAMTVIMSNVRISRISINSGGDRPTESMSFLFAKIKVVTPSGWRGGALPLGRQGEQVRVIGH
jgi:type VI protein secretion system component Hcp